MSYYLLRQGYEIEKTENSKSGTKIYTNAPNTSDPIDQLPEIGDSWDDGDNDDLLLRTIQESFISDKCDYKLYRLNYSTRVEDSLSAAGNESENDLPVSISLGAEMIAWTPPKQYESSFQWKDATGYVTALNDSKINTTIQRRICLITYTFTRRVTDLTSFKIANLRNINRINSSTFYGIPRGYLLYTGADMESQYSPVYGRFWIARMNMILKITSPERAFDGNGNMVADVDGWNYALRESDGQFSRPYFNISSSYLYQYSDFKGLITSGYGIYQPQVINQIGT